MHLLKLRRTLEQAVEDDIARGYELPLAATIALENTLIAVHQEGALAGKREGYLLGLEAGRAAARGSVRPGPLPAARDSKATPLSFPPPVPSDDDTTPVRPSIPWRGPRRRRDD